MLVPYRLGHQCFSKRLTHDLRDKLLLGESAVYLCGDDNRIRRRDEGVFRDSLTNFAKRDLGGQRLAVIDHRLGITVVDVDYSANRMISA